MTAPFSLDMFRLDGRSALVTGAGSGLGRVFAGALAAAGARLVCADIDEEGAQETAGLIGQDGGQAIAVRSDVADEASVEAMVAEAGRAFGPIDILVNNAGIATKAARVHELPVADWDRLQAINTRGVFLCTRAVLPMMLAQGKGSVISISSIAGLGGVDPAVGAIAANYSASKAAVIGFTRQAAAEYAADGIRFNAIAPGWHLGTRLGRETLDLDSEEAMTRLGAMLVAGTPMRRVGAPEELAGLILYLASDASGFVTGQVIAHDGGWSAW